MDDKDIEAAFKAYEHSHRENWEQTRVLAYNVVAPYMKDEKSITSFMPLPWDKKGQEQKQIKPPTREDFERLKKRFNLK